MQEIIEFSQCRVIKFEKSKTSKLLPNPNSKENKRQLFTAFKPSKKFPFANCSETIQVQARLNPEVARVIAKE